MGVTRARTIVLEIANTKSKGKTVVIAEDDAHPEFGMSPDEEKFIRDIDEASFDLLDSSGSSPGSKFTSRRLRGSDSAEADPAFQTPTRKTQPKNLGSDLSELGKEKKSLSDSSDENWPVAPQVQQ